MAVYKKRNRNWWDRFFEKVRIEPFGCWVWQGCKNSDGYGNFNAGGPVRTRRTKSAHIYLYTKLVGPAPEGLELDHQCNNRACVNPTHLRPSTHWENVHRAIRPLKTHCKYGHEFTAENTYISKGERSCRTCRIAYKKEWRRKRKMCSSCHVIALEVRMTDLDALEAAAKRLGWEFIRGKKDWKWYGRWVDDSPVGRNLFATEEEYQKVVGMPARERIAFMNTLLRAGASHTIRIPGRRYEVGVFEVGGTLQLAWDWYRGELGPVLGDPGKHKDVVNPIPAAYGIEAAKLAAQRQGFSCYEVALEDGAVEVHAVVQGW